MRKGIDRREFLKLAGIGGVVFASGLAGFSRTTTGAVAPEDFYFVQMSDTHWGFRDEKANPDWSGTLKKAVTAVNGLDPQPEFVLFTGDLSHTTDDPKERRKRLSEFREIVGGLKAGTVRFMPGEHDASLDNGEAFRELFGKTHYTFEHKGFHFIVLDNVSDPAAVIGESQLQWLADDLKGRDKEAPVVVMTHRPLFDLYPQWDWATRDGAKAVDLLMPFQHVTVFYGHIHQENHHQTGHIAHHSAMGLMYPLPAPGSVPKKAPVPWDPMQPYRGLGFRGVGGQAAGKSGIRISEYPLQK
jgi:hypothetical protein